VTRPKWQPKKKPGKPHPKGQPLNVHPDPAIDRWLAKHCVLDPTACEYSLNLQASWHNHCRYHGDRNAAGNAGWKWFGGQLSARGFAKSRCSTTGRILRHGIRLNTRLSNV
jgi:hypothetical protein